MAAIVSVREREGLDARSHGVAPRLSEAETMKVTKGLARLPRLALLLSARRLGLRLDPRARGETDVLEGRDDAQACKHAGDGAVRVRGPFDRDSRRRRGRRGRGRRRAGGTGAVSSGAIASSCVSHVSSGSTNEISRSRRSKGTRVERAAESAAARSVRSRTREPWLTAVSWHLGQRDDRGLESFELVAAIAGRAGRGRGEEHREGSDGDDAAGRDEQRECARPAGVRAARRGEED